MTSKAFVAKALDIALHYKTLYVNGTWGWPMTQANKARALKNKNNQGTTRRAKIEAAGPDVFGFDCVGLWKGILWGWSGNKNAQYGGAGFAPAHGVPDLNETSFFEAGYDFSTDFTKAVPGAMVWRTGHIGCYIGDGLVIECTPSWADGVQITTLDQRKTAEGYKYRSWTKWAKCLYLQYEEEMTYEIFKDYTKRYEEETKLEPASKYAEEALVWAKALGIMQGSGTGKLMPQSALKRQDFAVMLKRYDDGRTKE